MCELVFFHDETGKFARLAKPAKFEQSWHADMFCMTMKPPPGLKWCKICDEEILTQAISFDELIDITKDLHRGKNFMLMIRDAGKLKHPYLEPDYYGTRDAAKKMSEFISPGENCEWEIIEVQH